MNIISPLHTKQIIADVPDFKMQTMASDEQEQEIDGEVLSCSRWDEYTLFRLLERQRILKLKGLYNDRRLGVPCIGQKSYEGAFSLAVPPRYQCLDLAEIEGFFSQKHKQLHHYLSGPSQNQDNGQWKSELDEATLLYLTDLAKALNNQHSSQTRSLTPLHFLPLSSNMITPPSTPLLISLEELDISPLSLDMQPEEGRNEVDLSDEEIMSLWSCTLPSDDGVDFDMFQ